jgi:GNAT superfamily N-acetyltransferase
MKLLNPVSESLKIWDPRYSFDLFSKWTPSRIADFKSIEEISFRAELRYSDEELIDREAESDFEALLIYLENLPLAVILLYRDNITKNLYLDTVAVTKPGQGLGTFIFKTIISTAVAQGWKGIALDTEWMNERGQKLVEFYQKLGFKVDQTSDTNGNIHLLYNIPRGSSTEM